MKRMKETCPNCGTELTEIYDFEREQPCLYCPNCGECIYHIDEDDMVDL